MLPTTAPRFVEFSALASTVFLLGVCAITALAFLWYEKRSPRRILYYPRATRRVTNTAFLLTNHLFIWVYLALIPAAEPHLSWLREYGFLVWSWFPLWLECAVAVIVLDAIMYGQHTLFHKVSVLWRAHRVHHSDLDVDATTGFRIHPIEMGVITATKLSAVLLIGFSPVAALVYELVFWCFLIFGHANIDFPRAGDRFLRAFLITPDLHRVHHSIYRDEAEANYGFVFTWWDRLFGTYRAEPEDSHQKMLLGINQFRSMSWFCWERALMQPFDNNVDFFRLPDDIQRHLLTKVNQQTINCRRSNKFHKAAIPSQNA